MAGESAREEARRAREKAERLARRADMFEKGADGEAATAAVLSTLPNGWTAIHDVRWPSRRLANIDHILVGPGGIFVVDSKNWSGRITVANGHLRQNGRSRDKAVAACADAALAIAELAGPYADRVYPVLSFVTDEPAVRPVPRRDDLLQHDADADAGVTAEQARPRRINGGMVPAGHPAPSSNLCIPCGQCPHEDG